MIDLITDGPFPIGNVWFSNSWVDTVAEIKRVWVPSVIGPGLIDAYGTTTWINNQDDLDLLCDYLSTWRDSGYATKPEGAI
jgi:hypothetical protein